jgi:hypothetical protein
MLVSDKNIFKEIYMLKQAQIKREMTRVKDLGLPAILVRNLMKYGMRLNTFVWKDYGSSNRVLNSVYLDMKLNQISSRVNVGAIYGKSTENWFLALEITPGIYDFYTDKRFVVPYYKDLTLEQALRRLPREEYELFFVPTMAEEEIIPEEEESFPETEEVLSLENDLDIDRDLEMLERELEPLPMAASKKSASEILREIDEIRI